MKIIGKVEVELSEDDSKKFVIEFLEKEYGFTNEDVFIFEGAWYEELIHPHNGTSFGRNKLREASKMEQYVDRVIKGLKSGE